MFTLLLIVVPLLEKYCELEKEREKLFTEETLTVSYIDSCTYS